MARERRRRAQPVPPSSEPASPRKWIWFRNEPGGRKKAQEEFDAIEPTARAGLSAKIERYRKGESRPQEVDHLGDGILEIRHRVGNNHFRVLFTLWGRHCVALTAFYKNQRRTPQVDLRRARTRARRWVEVFGKEPPD